MNMNRARIKSIVVLNLCVYKCQAGDLPAQQILSTSRRPILKSLESCLIMDISFSPHFFRRFYDRAIEKLRALREIDLFLGFVAYREIVPRAPRGWVLVKLICMKIVTKILTTLSFPTDLTRRVSLGVSRIERNREHSTDFRGTRLRWIPRGIRSVSLFVCAASFCSPNFRDNNDLGSAVSRIMTSQRSCQEPGDQINWFGNGKDECLKFQVALIIWSVYWWGLRWFEYCALDWFVPVIYDLSETTENNKAVQY